MKKELAIKRVRKIYISNSLIAKILFNNTFEQFTNILRTWTVVGIVLITFPALDCPSGNAIFLSKFYL